MMAIKAAAEESGVEGGKKTFNYFAYSKDGEASERPSHARAGVRGVEMGLNETKVP